MVKRKPRNRGNSSPSSTKENDSEWLWAVNNQSTNASVNPQEAGKWLLFLQEDSANAAWEKIKTAVAEGELWRSCMSETEPESPKEFFEIMVFTKDHTDVDDVIRVLDYLESSEIKPHDENIKYVKGTGTSSNSKNWLYSANLIRSVGGSIEQIHEFDINKKELVRYSILRPTETLKSDFPWLHARNNKYPKSLDAKKQGKWMIILFKNNVDAAWKKIKIAVTNGELWRCSVTTTDPDRPEQTYLVLIFTKDYADVDDVIHVLDYIEGCGIKPPNINIKYTSDSEDGQKLHLYNSITVRSVGITQPLHRDTYEFDIYKKELVTDCIVCPTEGLKISRWLTAKNNRYTDEEIDTDKMGKWMLFLPQNRVNKAWDRIKEAVAKGELWFAKVCTDPEKSASRSCYTVFVYTIDYSDRSDVACVHEYLTSSGIKPPDVVIKYKSNQQMHADSQSGVKQKSYMYTSKTLQASDSTESRANCTYKFDIHKNELITDCKLFPTQGSEVPEWLFAENNKHIGEEIDPAKVGKWMVFLPVNKVNVAWRKVKEAVAKGQLWTAKVSTTPSHSSGGDYVIFIYTKDYTDVNDVICALACLESSGIKLPNKSIKYKTEIQTHVGKQIPWMYCSNTVRSLAPAQPKINSICDTYEFDVDSNKLITDCKAYPAEVSKITPWLTAKNNKYKEEEIDDEKVGKWMLFLPKTSINATWDKIKMAVVLGELWSAKVATKPETSSFRGFYAVHIYTKDYSDQEDVIGVLDYLESSKIKPENTVFKYSSEQQTLSGADKSGKKRSWMYSSDTIRSMGDLIRNA